MNIIISGQHLKLFPKTEEYAIKKIEKLEKFHRNILKVNAHLIAKQAHQEKEQDFICELTVDIPGKNLEIVDVEESMDKAIDKAVERMRRLLTRDKEKGISKAHSGGLYKKD